MSANTRQHDGLTQDQLGAGVSLETSCTHTLVVKQHKLHIRLPIDPADSRTMDDRFTLIAKNGGSQLRQTKTIKDDRTPGDQYVDLIYEGIKEDYSYTLEIDPGTEGSPYFLFEDIPFSNLFDP